MCFTTPAAVLCKHATKKQHPEAQLPPAHTHTPGSCRRQSQAPGGLWWLRAAARTCRPVAQPPSNASMMQTWPRRSSGRNRRRRLKSEWRSRLRGQPPLCMPLIISSTANAMVVLPASTVVHSHGCHNCCLHHCTVFRPLTSIGSCNVPAPNPHHGHQPVLYALCHTL